jgi:hypothetical protein
MDAFELAVSFSETVAFDSLDLTMLTLFGRTEASLINITGFGSGQQFRAPVAHGYKTVADLNSNVRRPIDSVESSVVVINLGFVDANEVKRLEDLATNANTTLFLAIDPGAVRDLDGNANVGKTFGDAVGVTVFVADSQPPILEQFTLDLSAATLDLTFNEIVRLESLRSFRVALQSTMTGTAANHTLGNSTILVDFVDHVTPNGTVVLSSSLVSNVVVQTDDNRYVVSLRLDRTDVNELSKDDSIATVPQNTYVQLFPAAVADMNNNWAGAQVVGGVGLAHVVTDAVRPVLLDFDADFDTGTLTLRFSETVRASTFLTDSIIVTNGVNQGNAAGERYTLSRASSTYLYHTSVDSNETHIISGDDATMMLSLGRNDLNALKQLRGIRTAASSAATHQGALSTNPSLVSSTSVPFVQDMFGNAVETRFEHDAANVAELVVDAKPPAIIAFDIDLNESTLTLEFDETVDVLTLSVADVVVSRDGSSPGNLTGAVRLSTGTHVINAGFRSLPHGTNVRDNPTVQLQLSPNDVNRIKNDVLLLVGAFGGVVVLEPGAVQDTAGNTLATFETGAVRTVIADATRPSAIQGLVEFDLLMGQITLSFDEPVSSRVGDAHLSAFTVTTSTGVYALTEDSPGEAVVVTSADGTVAVFHLNATDLSALQANRGLASSIGLPTLAFTGQLLTDTAAFPNPVLPTLTPLTTTSYQYYDTPTVTAIQPNSGIAIGRTAVTIIGTGFVQQFKRAASRFSASALPLGALSFQAGTSQ